ncbi:MAG: deferrochelatase/peroxidase EfeB [Solirubrobacterales bacterium]|nr:deferrochelatase/peroxidase EfeB [Solirubrobacterales bacterium]
MTNEPKGKPDGRGLTRRGLIKTAGAAGAGLGLGAGGFALGSASAAESDDGTGTVPFRGERQAGVVTAAQDRLHFAAFDVTTTSRAELVELLRAWTAAAARMTEGELAGPRNDEPLLPPEDTGEALGLLPSRLTITFGFGPTLFESAGAGRPTRGAGADRFGLSRLRPPALRELPPLPAEAIEPARSGGDLCVQACADDPQVAFHAVRNLARIGRGKVVLRWSQLGFGRTSTTTRAQATPRNLMGLKDGTNNIRAEDAEALDEHVWAGAEAPAWLRGGTYLVARRIRMLIEVWDRATLSDQELTIGRAKYSGAPLTGSDEFDQPNLAARGADGPVIPRDAHVRLAAPQLNAGTRILRRGYSFTDGFDEVTGQLDAGLFFISFQRDPARFEAIQRNLGRDALNEYVKHTSSAVFAIPPGTREGTYIGQALLEA